MVRTIKNYWAFTKWGYRLGILVVLPVFLVAVNALGFIEEGEGLTYVLLLCTYLLITPFDIMSDYFVLGGLYAKNNGALEFLQTSNRFERIIRDVVWVDIIRRFFLYIGLYGIVFLLDMLGREYVEWDAYRWLGYLPLLSFVIAQIAVFVARHYTSWLQVWLAASLSCMLCVLLHVAIMLLEVSTGILGSIQLVENMYILWLIYAGLFIFAALSAVIMVWYSVKKVRDSYYDK